MYRGVVNDTTITTLADPTINSHYDPKLIAGYRFDVLGGTTVYDESAESNNGTLVNSVERLSPSYTTNNVCLEFEAASNQYVVAPMSSDSEFNQMTLCAWVNTTSNSNQTLLHKEGCFTWSLDSTGKSEFILGSTKVNDTSNVPIGSWTHVAATVDQYNSKVSFFTNGDFSSSNDLSEFDIPQNSSNLFIGWDSNTTYYDGKMDDVLIYDEVLTNSQIGDIGNLTIQSSYYTTSSNIASDSWTHVAATYDKTEGIIQLYHDASNVASYSNYSVDIGTNDNVMTIGRSDASTYYYGKMDDVRIYDKVLSQESVASLYNRYFVSPNAGHIPPL